MWDWSSFVSGLIGAVLGGGVAVFLGLLRRKDEKKEAKKAAVEVVIGRVVALSESVLDSNSERPLEGQNMTLMLRAWDAVSALGRVMTVEETPLREWVQRAVIMLSLFPEVREQSSIRTGIVAHLDAWLTGRKSAVLLAEAPLPNLIAPELHEELRMTIPDAFSSK